jgi:excisionase family DNA binding protein
MKLAFTIKEACREIGIGRTKLYQEIAAGRLTVRKANKRTVILAEDLQQYLKSLPVLELPLGR